jgi:hypothetical protein
LESLAAISTQSYLPNILKSEKIASSLHGYRYSFSSEAIRQFVMGAKKLLEDMMRARRTLYSAESQTFQQVVLYLT